MRVAFKVTWLRSRPIQRSPCSTFHRHYRSHPSTAIKSDGKPADIKLRSYQEDSIQAVLKYLSNGEKRLGLSLATGSGKTVYQIPEYAPTQDATQTLILAHRRELVEQAAKHCLNLYPGKTVDIEMGKVHASGQADITCASIQSILSGERLYKYDPDCFKLLLVDEAHHIVAPTYLGVLKHFKLVDKDKDRQGPTALVGVSATFSRSDGLTLGAAIDHIVYHKDYVDMIDDKWLADVKFTTVQSGADLSKVKTTHGDFQVGSLSRAVNNPVTNVITVRSWLAEASDRKSTLVFCVDRAHVTALTATFRAHGLDARFITGETDVDLRADTLASFKAGEFPVLLNCGIFTEGTDIPNIDCVLLARPTKSRNLLIQMIGRGLRQSQGKDDCLVIDMVASLERGIVTTPTLFGLDPHEIVKKADGEELKRMSVAAERSRNLQTFDSAVDTASLSSNRKITFTRYDDVNSLIADTSGEQHIRWISRLSWVQVDNQRYILSDRSGTFLTIKNQERVFLVTATEKLPKLAETASARYRKAKVLATTSTFEDAVHAADTYAKEKLSVQYLFNNASWRKFPATPEQISFLNRFRDEDKKLEAESITKGRASDWITKIKFGARGRLQRMKTEQAKVMREKEKDEKVEEMQRRMQVRAGPLES